MIWNALWREIKIKVTQYKLQMYCLIEVVAKTGLTSYKFNYHTITITMTAGKGRSTVLMKRTLCLRSIWLKSHVSRVPFTGIIDIITDVKFLCVYIHVHCILDTRKTNLEKPYFYKKKRYLFFCLNTCMVLTWCTCNRKWLVYCTLFFVMTVFVKGGHNKL